MKLHEISNNGSLTPAQIKWLDEVIDGTYEVVDGKLNVEGDVNITSDTTSLLVQFGKVTGYFNCHNTKITSLEGCPSQVGDFSCSETGITSLEGCPSQVRQSFDCSHTQITSLEGCPSKVGGSFSCNNTKITSLEYCPSVMGGYFNCAGTEITSLIGVADNITQINGNFWNRWTEIKSGGLGLVLISRLTGLAGTGVLLDQFKIISKYLGKPDLIFDCQAELIEAGFEEYAQL